MFLKVGFSALSLGGIGRAYLTDGKAAEFTDYIAKVTKDSLAKDISNSRFYACLNDGSTDSSVIEQELVYVLFLCEGRTTVEFFSIESVKHDNAPSIVESLDNAFQRFGMTSFTDD